jgi:hypothetical protein
MRTCWKAKVEQTVAGCVDYYCNRIYFSSLRSRVASGHLWDVSANNNHNHPHIHKPFHCNYAGGTCSAAGGGESLP